MTIRIDQPRELDLVGNPVLVSGVGTGFEATLSYRVHDGHDEVTVPVILGSRLVAGYVGYREHVVQRGDTLWAIAEANYGKGSDFSLIVRANPNQITDPDRIFPGQVLKIPIGD